MFYSQFILAKKGPLGTIWIAAHLERKLRKNQVADTDIGVSVDSILFPDAPIALRLSSHLLLGVVRIYSKKVNYLFNDCSEALIKIKHAFRSTAVDLPPEESTAPYHSITLPENFDLDNFELPDSACLDSNFVDHHVSTREQITLQDTLNDTAFPTSKFGLDEKFGDEDTSHIGLELVEELFMDKKISPQHDEVSMSLKVSGSHYGETSVPSTSMGMDVQFGYEDEKCIEIPNELSELLSNNYDKNDFADVEDLKRDTNSSHRHGYTIQTPDLNEVFQPECRTDLSQRIPFNTDEDQTPCVAEPAQEPSTPGLLEVVPSNFQEVPALSPQEKNETYVESGRPGSCSGSYMEVESAEAGNITVLISEDLGHKSGETAQELPHTSALIGPMTESLAPTYSSWNLTTDNVCLVSGAEYQQCGLTGNEVSNISTAGRMVDNDEAINPSVFVHEAINLASPPKLAARFEAEPVSSNICTDDMDVSGGILDVKMTHKKDGNDPSKIASLGHVEDVDFYASTSVARSDFLSISSGSNQLPIFVHDDPSGLSHKTINLKTNLAERLEAEPVSFNIGTRFEAEPVNSNIGTQFEADPVNSNYGTRFEAEAVNSNIGTNNMDVSRDILDAKRTQKSGNNEPSQIGNQVGAEDGNSCISASVVESGFLSRSCGSNLHPILLHSDPSGFSHETVNLTSPEARFEAPITSNISADEMDVSGGILDVKMTPKKHGNESSQIVNLSHVEVGVEDGYSCISTSVVGSDFLPRSCGPNLHSISLHGDISGFSHEAINMTPPKLAAHFEVEPVTSNICMDNMDVSGSISNVKSAQKKDSNEPSQIANLSRAEDGDSCVSTSVVGSDFFSRSCGSNLHQSSTLFVDGALGEASESSLRDHSCSLKTPRREEMLHNFRSSFEVQGEDLRYSNDRVISLEGQHMSRCTSDIKYGASKMDELSMGVFSHLNHVNFSSSSEFLGPEKMLAPTFVVDIPNYQGLQAADKRVMESDGSLDRNSSPYSRKRRVMDSTTVLQTDNSVKLAGISRSRRYADYIPDDDDILTSILGRASLSLKTDTIPSLSKVQSQKRPRTMSRVGMPKRKKVLVDDAMVLHADAIRQQLINTEDIRRTRKKAPCSRPNIWKIYIGAMEEDIFDHSILTGMSVELNSLHGLKYVMQKNPSSQAKEYNSQIKTSGETGSSRVSEFLNRMGDKQVDERISSVPGSSRVPEFVNRMGEKEMDERISPVPGSSGVSEFLNRMGDKQVDERISSVPGSSRVPEFVYRMGEKEMDERISPVPWSSRVSEFLNRMGDKEVDERISSVSGSSRVSEFVNRMGEKEMDERISSVPDIVDRDEGSTRLIASDTEFLNGMGDKEMDERISSVSGIVDRDEGPTSTTAASDTEFLNGMGDKKMDERISSVSGIVDRDEGPTSTTAASDTEFLTGMGDKKMDESILSAPDIVDRDEGPTSITASDTVQTHEGGTLCDLHHQLEELPFQPQVEPFGNDQMSVICAMQPDAEGGAESILQETPIPEINESISSLEKLADQNINLAERSPHNDAHNSLKTTNDVSSVDECATLVGIDGDTAVVAVTLESLIEPENVCNNVGAIINNKEKTGNVMYAEHSKSSPIWVANNGDTDGEVVNIQGHVLTNGGEELLLEETNGSAVAIDTDHSVVALGDGERPVTDVTGGAELLLKETNGSAVAIDTDHSVVALGDGERPVTDVTGGAELLLEETNGPAVAIDTDHSVAALGDGERPVTDVTCAEVHDVTCAEVHDVTCVPSSIEHVPSTVGEIICLQGVNLEGGLDVDSMTFDDGAVRDSKDFRTAIDDHYTGFLNEDEVELEEAENGEPKPEDAQSMENSGWSARTRGVARYLKNLFDEESGQGRKSVVVNLLLSGKTRKEASRMFFETLVLKTRDYIQVEQEKPFEHINIKPRIKLLKSEF